MKKTYVKPALYAEQFSISEHIASCQAVVSFTEQTCAAFDKNGLKLFATQEACGAEAVNKWTFMEVPEGQWDYAHVGELGLDCYNAFYDPSSFFTS